MSVKGGNPGDGFTYETLAGDVCTICGAVVADKTLHDPCPIASLRARIKRLGDRVTTLERE
jgi:hypothetical protein